LGSDLCAIAAHGGGEGLRASRYIGLQGLLENVIQRFGGWCAGWVRSADVGLPFAVERTSGPMGVTGIPGLSIQSRKSGGMHKWTFWPRAFNCSASATSG
jgi:hypothetical protein